MPNQTFLLKSIAIASLSLIAIITPSNLPPSWGQGTPATAEAAKAEVKRLIEQGIKQYQQGQMETAIATYQQALLLAQRYSFREYEATLLIALGQVYNSISQPEKALKYHNQALPILIEVRNRLVEGKDP
jgi:tetratricopeptide (TPR) repeat protein